MNGPVLLLDDHRETVDVLGRLLELHGLPVIALEDPVTALKLLYGGLQPSVVVTDQLMPELYGTDVVRALRTRPGCERTWVIILSASPIRTPHDRYTLFRKKPIEPTEFVALVDRLSRIGGRGEPVLAR